MSDIAKPVPPGQEKAHNGNTTPQPKPAGQELATVKNSDLAHDYKTDLSR